MSEDKNELILLESYLEDKEAYKARILLDKNKIHNKYFCSRSNIEKAYLISNSNPTEIWVKQLDFENAYNIINQNKLDEENDIQITDFSNDELINIIKNKDEWHESFINEAVKLIKKRNIPINEEEINQLNIEKLNLIKQGKEAHPATLFIFWLLTFMSVFFLVFGFFGFIFGFSGTIAGFLYWKSTIKASDGNRYFLFNKKTQAHGKYMFFTGLILISALFIYVYYYFIP